MEDEIQRYLADFPQIFSFDKQRELISQFKFLLNQAKAEKFGTQCDDAWSCLGPVLKTNEQGIHGRSYIRRLSILRLYFKVDGQRASELSTRYTTQFQLGPLYSKVLTLTNS